jgi:iron complex outermembrane receptor protein
MATRCTRKLGDPDRPDFDVTAKASSPGGRGAYRSTERTAVRELFREHQYPFSPQGRIYNLSPAGFDYFKANVKPERSSSVDFGVRTKRAGIEASLSSYYINYRNRLVSVANCQLTAFCASVFANVGTVTSKGLEGLLVWQLTPRVSWNSSASYNSSTINDNYSTGTATGSTVILSKGKDAVDAPRVMANSAPVRRHH